MFVLLGDTELLRLRTVGDRLTILECGVVESVLCSGLDAVMFVYGIVIVNLHHIIYTSLELDIIYLRE